MDKRKESGSSGKNVSKPKPSPETGSRGNELENKPYNKTQRRKNTIKPDSHAQEQFDDNKAEDILAQDTDYGDGDDYNEPLPPAKEPMSAHKRKIRRVLFYVTTVVMALIVCSLLSLTVFFKIDEIYIEGDTRYAAEEIIAASMIKKNDNLILCNTLPGEKKIVEKFPYIETADIQKKLFNKIAIKVTEAKPNSIIENKGKYFVLSKKGKIIEIDNEKKYDVPVILGVKLKNEKLCSYEEYDDINIKNYINEIMGKVREYNIKDIATIDITNPVHIVLFKKNGFTIILGTPEDLDYKFRSIKEILDSHVSDKDIGTLDVSVVNEEGAKSFFNSQLKEESSQPEPSKTDKQESKEGSVSTESSVTSEEVSVDEMSEEESEDTENSDEESENDDEDTDNSETDDEDNSGEDTENDGDDTEYSEEDNTDDDSDNDNDNDDTDDSSDDNGTDDSNNDSDSEYTEYSEYDENTDDDSTEYSEYDSDDGTADMENEENGGDEEEYTDGNDEE